MAVLSWRRRVVINPEGIGETPDNRLDAVATILTGGNQAETRAALKKGLKETAAYVRYVYEAEQHGPSRDALRTKLDGLMSDLGSVVAQLRDKEIHAALLAAGEGIREGLALELEKAKADVDDAIDKLALRDRRGSGGAVSVLELPARA